MMCFIELLKRVGHNYNPPINPLVYARLRELHISRHDWRGCRGGRKLPRRGGKVGNGSDEATYDGPEGVNQSDTVSIPAVAPGQPIPTRVIASAEPPRYTQPRCPPSRNLTDPVCKQSVSTCMKLCVMNCCSMKEKTRLPYILDHVRDNKCDLVALTETWLSPDVSKNASVVQECADYGYKLFHIPCPTRRGGGVGILVKDNISIVRNKLPHLAHTTFEHIELLITSISIHIRLVVVYRPPQSNINKNTKVQFIEEFGDFVEKLSACSGRLLLCGDFNINWMDKDNSCVKKLFNLLETYNLVQHITEPTHRSQHLLDYIISDAELVNSAGVSDFVSDHCVLHASLVCTRSHPKRKQITFRPLKTIDHDLLSTDIGKIDFNLDSKNVDSIVDNYNTVFTSLLDKHAPLKTDYVVPRDVQPWMTEEIMSTRREKRKGERVWRKSRLEVHLQMFIALCLTLKNIIHGEKEQFFKKQI